MASPQHIAPYALALAALVITSRVAARARRTLGRQSLRLGRLRFSAYFLPVALFALFLGASRHPLSALAQLAGIALGFAAATYSFRTTRLEVVDGSHFYTPNPYVGTAIVALFIARVIYRFTTLYTATGGFMLSPGAIIKSPVSVLIAGLLLGFYSSQAWFLLRWFNRSSSPSSASSSA